MLFNVDLFINMRLGTFLLLLATFFVGCEKTYYPDPNASRDSLLVGTWGYKGAVSFSELRVFTSEGYCDIVEYIKNNDKYTNLDGIWENRTMEDMDLDVGLIYSKCTNSNFSHKAWENYEYYKLSENSDTLFIRDRSATEFEIFVRSKIQLIYEGPFFVGADTIQ